MKWISENDDDQAMDQAHYPSPNTDHSGMLLFTACGGGGGSDSASTSGQRFRPTARSGAPRRHYQYHVNGYRFQSITEINPLTQGVMRIVVTDADDNPVAKEVISATTTLGSYRA